MSDLLRRRQADQKRDDEILPEGRVSHQLYGIIFSAAGILMYGWFCHRRVHVAGVLASSVLGRATIRQRHLSTHSALSCSMYSAFFETGSLTSSLWNSGIRNDLGVRVQHQLSDGMFSCSCRELSRPGWLAPESCCSDRSSFNRPSHGTSGSTMVLHWPRHHGSIRCLGHLVDHEEGDRVPKGVDGEGASFSIQKMNMAGIWEDVAFWRLKTDDRACSDP